MMKTSLVLINLIFNLFLYSSNHSGNNGSSGSLPSSAGPSLNSEDINNGDHLLNNNTVDNGIAEVCDVPDDVANQKRHVSNKFCVLSATLYARILYSHTAHIYMASTSTRLDVFL